MGPSPHAFSPSAAIAARRATRHDEVADVMELLLDHVNPAAGSALEAARMAEWLAVACLGDHHLWQDLHLPSREALSALIAHWFPALKARNQHDMKWKKFFYKQLCEREQISICKSPSCAECCDYAACFGPELA